MAPKAKKVVEKDSKFSDQIKIEDKFKTINVKRGITDLGYRHCTIEIINKDLKYFLQNNYEQDVFYQNCPRFAPALLLDNYDDIISHADEDEDDEKFLKELICVLKFELYDAKHFFDEISKKEMITFDTLSMYFKTDQEIYHTSQNEIVAGIIKKTTINYGFGGRSFVIFYEVIKSNGKGLFVDEVKISIKDFDGLLSIHKLNVKKMTPDIKESLSKRGEKFIKYCSTPSYVQYSGNLFIQSWFGVIAYNSEGRILVDNASYNRNNPNDDDSDDNNELESNLESDKYFICYPFLKGFSFSLKKWGEFAVSKMEDIVFADDAFKNLVLDQSKKDLIMALVKQNSSGGFQDIIKGKSGGCIFLLDGSPGVGKTLTAEAVAEVLHRPLYMVSVGELGVEPTQLEESLRKILDMASSWNAIILIDEADIFLEARDEHNILRNAMVGIFLRLLEYHTGILFLTTNRVKNFDEAFHSRISVALHYEPHNEESRMKIWENLLKYSGIVGIDIKELAKHPLNGRQIKNCIRLAQSLAREQGVDVNIQHVNTTIGFQSQRVKPA